MMKLLFTLGVITLGLAIFGVLPIMYVLIQHL